MYRDSRPSPRQEELARRGLTPLTSAISTAISFGILGVGMLGYEGLHFSPIASFVPAGITAFLNSLYVTKAFQSDEGLLNTSGSFLSQYPTTRSKVYASIGSALIPSLVGVASAAMVHTGLDTLPFVNDVTKDTLTAAVFLLPPVAATRQNIVTRNI